MKKSIILLIIFAILSGCNSNSSQSDISTKEKEIIELKSQIKQINENNIKDNIFFKKQECIKYKEEMLSFAKKYHSDVYELKEIFYSPLKNSCYFIAKEWLWKELIFDYLNASVVEWKWFESDCWEIKNNQTRTSCYERELNNNKNYEKILIELKRE